MQCVQEEIEKLVVMKMKTMKMMMMVRTIGMLLGSPRRIGSHGVTWPLVARESLDGVTTARAAARKPWSIFSAISWTRAMKYLETTQTGGEWGTTRCTC